MTNNECGNDCKDCLKFTTPNGSLSFRCNSNGSSPILLIIMGMSIAVLAIFILIILVYYKNRNRLKKTSNRSINKEEDIIINDNIKEVPISNGKTSSNPEKYIFNSYSIRTGTNEDSNKIMNKPKIYSQNSLILTSVLNKNHEVDNEDKKSSFKYKKVNTYSCLKRIHNSQKPPLQSMKGKIVFKTNNKEENYNKSSNIEIGSLNSRETNTNSNELIIKSFSEKR